MLRRINASEIISSVKPEFAQYTKKVKYKPIDPMSSLYIPEKLSDVQKSLIEQQFISKIDSNTDAQIIAAKGAIESYAKQKNVTIDMARRMNVVEGNQPTLKDQIEVCVYNPKTKAHEFAFVPVFDQNQTANTVKKSNRVFTNADGIDVIKSVQSEYEDNFIRHLYRNIERAVEKSFTR